jgi:hypothetical protein
VKELAGLTNKLFTIDDIEGKVASRLKHRINL